MRLGRPVLPREHGVWAMIVAPWLLAVAVGGVTWRHVALLGAALGGYLAVAAVLTYLRTAPARRDARPLWWAALYGVVAASAGAPLVIARPLLLIAIGGAALALPVELLYLGRRDERALLNGVASIVALTLSGPAALFVAAPRFDARLALLWSSCLALFGLSLLYVRSRIRARRSHAFATATWIAHVALPAAFVGAGHALLGAALLPSLLRLALSHGRALSPKAVGLIELGNALLFVAIAALALRSVG